MADRAAFSVEVEHVVRGVQLRSAAQGHSSPVGHWEGGALQNHTPICNTTIPPNEFGFTGFISNVTQAQLFQFCTSDCNVDAVACLAVSRLTPEYPAVDRVGFSDDTRGARGGRVTAIGAGFDPAP